MSVELKRLDYGLYINILDLLGRVIMNNIFLLILLY